MTKIAALLIAPSSSRLSPLLAAIDRILMINAEIAHRNGDLPYFGL